MSISIRIQPWTYKECHITPWGLWPQGTKCSVCGAVLVSVNKKGIRWRITRHLREVHHIVRRSPGVVDWFYHGYRIRSGVYKKYETSCTYHMHNWCGHFIEADTKEEMRRLIRSHLSFVELNNWQSTYGREWLVS